MIASVVYKQLKALNLPVHVAEQLNQPSPSIPHNIGIVPHTLPACIVTVPDSERLNSLKGPVATQRGTVRVACLGKTHHGADRLATQVTDALAGTSGPHTFDATGGQTQTVTVKYLHHDDTRELPSEHRDGENHIATHGFAVDFRFAMSINHTLTAA